MNTLSTVCARSSPRAPSISAAATSSARVTSGGMKITITASTPGSRPTIRIASRYCSAGAEASRSTGLETLASPGSTARSARWVSSASTGTSSPSATQVSAHRIPGPPALVRIATRRPRGGGWLATSAATSNIWWRESVRITPVWRKSASTVTSEAAIIAPVCEVVARTPAGERPLFTTTIGLVRATRRAMVENLRGFPNDSR